MFLWNYQSFWCIKCLDLREETRTSNLRIHAECFNHLSYQGHTFAVPCFFKQALAVQIFLKSKSTFKILTVHGQQHLFSTHKQMFLWKCQRFWNRKYVDLRETRTPNLRIHAECSNHLSNQGQPFAVPCFWKSGSGGTDIFDLGTS